jgi:hypothetical protein
VRSRVTATLAAAVATTAALAGCSDGDDGPDARDFAGSWDVQLVVGAVDADPAADPASFPGDTSFRERWVFEDCDEQTCTLRRPEGGLLLGDLDDVGFAFVDAGSVDDTLRFTGDATADAVARVDPEPPPEDGEVVGPVAPGDDEGEGDDGHGHEGEAEGGADAACYGTPAYRWDVHIEVDVVDGVLSGTVLRIPEELRTTVEGTGCFGIDLTLGLSGTPTDGSTDTPPG